MQFISVVGLLLCLKLKDRIKSFENVASVEFTKPSNVYDNKLLLNNSQKNISLLK